MRTHLVIPCFRESRRLGPFLDELCRCAAADGSVSILVVEDGSGPEEQMIICGMVEERRTRFPFLKSPLLLETNVGKGGAVYAGWEKGEGEEWLAFVDADGACPADEVMRLVRFAREAGDVSAIFASRVLMLGRKLERKWHRHVAGRIFAFTVSLLLDIPVHDSQCGLKLVRRRAWERVAPFLQIHDFGFDAELLAALVDAGCGITEVPVDWHEVPGGKLHLVQDSWKMLRELIALRQRRRCAEWSRLRSPVQ